MVCVFYLYSNNVKVWSENKVLTKFSFSLSFHFMLSVLWNRSVIKTDMIWCGPIMFYLLYICFNFLLFVFLKVLIRLGEFPSRFWLNRQSLNNFLNQQFVNNIQDYCYYYDAITIQNIILCDRLNRIKKFYWSIMLRLTK